MAVFNRGSKAGVWEPTALASGPFKGLQGGAVAGLLVGEIEGLALEHDWGQAISAGTWFLRPAPSKPLKTSVEVVHQSNRLSVIDNSLRTEDGDTLCAMTRVTLSKPRAIDVQGFYPAALTEIDPQQYPLHVRPAPHGGAWFMDAMELRLGERIFWFRLNTEVIENAGPLARILGPADWAHGLSRPTQNVVADPNPNLNVHLSRAPRGEWIGVEPQTHWQPEIGGGMGGGYLHDCFGVVGRVSMSVVLMPFPNAAAKS